jgi:hypothetical protein
MDQGSLSGPAESFGQAFSSLVAWALAWWVGGDDPNLSAVRANVAAIRPVTAWTTAVALGLAIVAAAAVLMVRRTGADLAVLLLGLARTALVLSTGWLLLASAWAVSDGLARWVVGGSADTRAYTAAVSEAMSEVDPALGLTLAIVGIAACLGFVAAVLARFVLAILLAAGLPVLIAMTVLRSTGSVRVGLSWVVAVVAFKPLNALVYRIGHGLLTSTDDPVLVLLIASMSFVFAASLLPAVARVMDSLHTVAIR